MKKSDFPMFLHSINRCYSLETFGNLPVLNDFPEDIFSESDDLLLDLLQEFSTSQSNIYISSVVNRILAILNIQQSRESGEPLDIKTIWSLISDSIKNIPNDDTISSIGSQGFLSIPIYKNDSEMSNFDFIRLHIWDKSLSEFINTSIRDNFAIHTHTFFAKSWIIAGELMNARYLVQNSRGNTDHSIFKVEYNKSLNEVNQHVSRAINTNRNVDVKQLSKEIYFEGGTYEIAENSFHKSDVNSTDGIAATFFSFQGQKGYVDSSFVVGPKKIDSSEINRKMHIDASQLLRKIDSKISTL